MLARRAIPSFQRARQDCQLLGRCEASSRSRPIARFCARPHLHRSLRGGRHVARRYHGRGRPARSLRARGLLWNNGAAVEAVLETRRLFRARREPGALAVLGFPQELLACRWLPPRHVRNKRGCGASIPRGSNGVLISLPDRGAGAMREFTVVAPRFECYVLGNAGVEELAGGFRWIEGPVWMGDADCLLFQDLPRNRTMRWSETTGVSVYREPSNYANGQTRDREGRLVACSHRGRCLYRTEYDGTITTLVTHHDGRRLNSPNDVVVKSDGTIWFSDPLYGISSDYEGGRQESEQPPALYRFDPATGGIRVVAGDFDGPNGLAFSPDERRLYVAET